MNEIKTLSLVDHEGQFGLYHSSYTGPNFTEFDLASSQNEDISSTRRPAA